MPQCPNCAADVLTTPAGMLLNPAPGRMGLHLKDGTQLTGDQIRSPGVRGYYQHQCLPSSTKKQPASPSNQGELF